MNFANPTVWTDTPGGTLTGTHETGLVATITADDAAGCFVLTHPGGRARFTSQAEARQAMQNCMDASALDLLTETTVACIVAQLVNLATIHPDAYAADCQWLLDYQTERVAACRS